MRGKSKDVVICIQVVMAYNKALYWDRQVYNECTCGNWHSAHTAGSYAAMLWSSRLGYTLLLAYGSVIYVTTRA